MTCIVNRSNILQPKLSAEMPNQQLHLHTSLNTCTRPILPIRPFTTRYIFYIKALRSHSSVTVNYKNTQKYTHWATMPNLSCTSSLAALSNWFKSTLTCLSGMFSWRFGSIANITSADFETDQAHITSQNGLCADSLDCAGCWWEICTVKVDIIIHPNIGIWHEDQALAQLFFAVDIGSMAQYNQGVSEFSFQSIARSSGQCQYSVQQAIYKGSLQWESVYYPGDGPIITFEDWEACPLLIQPLILDYEST